MKTFLKVCLLLGVAAALILSAFGMCVLCASKSKSDFFKNCENYEKGAENFVSYCPSYGENPVCRTKITKDNEIRSCEVRKAGMELKMECLEPGDSDSGDWNCLCDKPLCNAPPTPGGGPGQQRALKGPSFGILGMVHLGGVWFIRGQLWG